MKWQRNKVIANLGFYVGGYTLLLGFALYGQRRKQFKRNAVTLSILGSTEMHLASVLQQSFHAFDAEKYPLLLGMEGHVTSSYDLADSFYAQALSHDQGVMSLLP